MMAWVMVRTFQKMDDATSLSGASGHATVFCEGRFVHRNACFTALRHSHSGTVRVRMVVLTQA